MELAGAILALRFAPESDKQKHIDALRSVVRKHCLDIVRRTQHQEALQAKQFADVSGTLTRAGQGDLLASALDSVKQELLERKLAIDEHSMKAASLSALDTSTGSGSIAVTGGTHGNQIHIPGAYPPSESDSAGDDSDNDRSLESSRGKIGSFAKEKPLKG
jgi:hypothetical protein